MVAAGRGGVVIFGKWHEGTVCRTRNVHIFIWVVGMPLYTYVKILWAVHFKLSHFIVCIFYPEDKEKKKTSNVVLRSRTLPIMGWRVTISSTIQDDFRFWQIQWKNNILWFLGKNRTAQMTITWKKKRITPHEKTWPCFECKSELDIKSIHIFKNILSWNNRRHMENVSEMVQKISFYAI